MANYEEAKVKLTNTQLNKLKSSAKNKTGTILRITKKKFQNEELPHELFLTTRQKIKIRNGLTKNMSTDIKLSKVQLSKIIKSGPCLGNMICNLSKFGKLLGKIALENFAVYFTKDVYLDSFKCSFECN